MACAGHGKTRWIQTQIADLCINNIKTSEILGFSYTNSAANTLRERLRIENGYIIDVVTMHSWCNAFRAYVNRQMQLDSENAKNGIKNIAQSHVVCLASMVREIISMEQENRKQFERLLLDFEKRTHLFIDEVQDSNEHQFELIRILSRIWKCRVVLVGDPNQSVFGFQGATPQQMLTFFNYYPVGSYEIIPGNTNMRSSPEIISVVNLNLLRMGSNQSPIIACAKLDTRSKYHNIYENLEKPMITAYANQHNEAIHIGKLVHELIHEHAVVPSEIVILNRYRNGLRYLAMILMDCFDINVNLESEDSGSAKNDHMYFECSVELRTMHSCKGGTWDFTFLTGMSDGNYREQDVDEEQRLFHVAITRPRVFLHISYSADKFRNSKLTRFITTEDIASGHYKVSDPTKDATIISIECWHPNDAESSTRKTMFSEDLCAKVYNSVDLMPMEYLRNIVSAIDSIQFIKYVIPIPTILLDNEDPGPVQSIVFPPVVLTHNMSEYFSTVVAQTTRVLCQESLRCVSSMQRSSLIKEQPLKEQFLLGSRPYRFPPSLVKMSLLPPLSKKHLQMLNTMIKESTLALSWNVDEWNPKYIQSVLLEQYKIERKETEMAMRNASKRTECIVSLCGNINSYTQLRSRYGLDNVIGREFSTLWDTLEHYSTNTKHKFQNCKQEFFRMHETILSTVCSFEEGTRSLMMHIMKICLLGDFMAFTRSRWRGCKTKNIKMERWEFSLDKCMNSPECNAIFDMIGKIIQWIRNMSGEIPTDQTSPVCNLDGEICYPTIFDYSATGMHFMIDCDAKERDSVSIHKVIAAVISLPTNEEVVQNIFFINVYTGIVQRFSPTQQDIRTIQNMYIQSNSQLYMP